MVLFLDEPTSGLDAASAVEIATLLTSLARHRNLLVVASIHQPSSRVFLNFDRVRVGWRAHCQGHAVIPTRRTLMMLNASPCLPQVMLLTRGVPAYVGEAGAATDYFEAIGYPCPANTNPADHLLDMTNSGTCARLGRLAPLRPLSKLATAYGKQRALTSPSRRLCREEASG